MDQYAAAAFIGADLLIGGVALMFIRRRDRAALGRAFRRDGEQEVRIVVERGYRPQRIELTAGVPAVLRFDRREDDVCSEVLVSELLTSVHRLAPHTETSVRFTPSVPGKYVFTCGLGMYSGLIVVQPASAR